MTDDITDMFRTLKSSKLPEGDVFAVTVGASSKQTLASYHVLEPADVIAAVEALNRAGVAAGSGAVKSSAGAGGGAAAAGIAGSGKGGGGGGGGRGEARM